MPLLHASWNTCYKQATTKVGWKLGIALLIWLRGEEKLPYSIKPKKPSQIDDLVSSFSNSPDSYTGTKLENHLWRLPCYYIQVVKNNESAAKKYIPRSSTVQRSHHQIWGTKHLYYWDGYQQEYSDGCASRRPQRKYKHLDVSKLFKPCCWPAPVNQPSSSFWNRFLKIPAPDFDPQIAGVLSKWEQERGCFRYGGKIINGPNVAFTMCQMYCSPEKAKAIFFLQELRNTATLQNYKYPFVHPTHLCVDDLPNMIQQYPQMPGIENPTSSHACSIQTPHFRKRAHSQEA